MIGTNTSPNEIDKLPGRLQGRYRLKSRDAGPVNFIALVRPILNQTPVTPIQKQSEQAGYGPCAFFRAPGSIVRRLCCAASRMLESSSFRS
jgi:hypothetical protein